MVLPLLGQSTTKYYPAFMSGVDGQYRVGWGRRAGWSEVDGEGGVE